MRPIVKFMLVCLCIIITGPCWHKFGLSNPSPNFLMVNLVLREASFPTWATICHWHRHNLANTILHLPTAPLKNRVGGYLGNLGHALGDLDTFGWCFEFLLRSDICLLTRDSNLIPEPRIFSSVMCPGPVEITPLMTAEEIASDFQFNILGFRFAKRSPSIEGGTGIIIAVLI